MAYMKKIYLSSYEEVLELGKEQMEELKTRVKQEKKEAPRHIGSEWGRFEGLHDLSEEQIDELAKTVLAEMTLEQKVNQMSGDESLDSIALSITREYNKTPYYGGEDAQLDLPAVKFSDGPTGVVMYHSTAFPVPVGRAASFDKELEYKIGDAIGTEIRAQGGNYYGGVCINLVRHPAWGRAQESFGEDPYLLGVMGEALTKGVQNHVMACIKHFAANSIENTRFEVDVDMDERSLREVYLPHFERCVKAGAASVMSAYNYFRGESCGHSAYLQRKILKDEWDFRGFILSDFVFCIRDTEDSVNSGMDIEMPSTIHWGTKLVEAVKKGNVREDVIDDAVLRLLRQKIRFAQINADKKPEPEKVVCKEHIALARRAAQESFVLLKNEGVLPLDDKKGQKILIAGKLAAEVNIGDGKGSSAVRPPYAVTPLEGIYRRVKNAAVLYDDGDDLKMTAQKARDADSVIVIAGLTCADEGEYMATFSGGADGIIGGDRSDLRLHGSDIRLSEACARNNRSVTVCVMGGSSIIMDPWCETVQGIAMIWYPGMEGGNALADILFGDVSPSGKLPVSIPKTESQLPFFRINAVKAKYDYYHGYFLADKNGYDMRYPFGYGLSYTDFELRNLRVSAKTASKEDVVKVLVDVSNTGSRAGTEIVQLYTGYCGPSVERHLKDLRGFERVTLEPGQTKTVSIPLAVSDLSYYDDAKGEWRVDPIGYRIIVGNSSMDPDALEAVLEVR